MAAKFMFLMDGTFDALEWLAAMCSHVPNRGEQMVRYYGHYSNVWRGNRQQENQDNEIPCIIEPDDISPTRRKAWVRLIQKIYEVDPLTCPKCTGAMKIISVIDQPEVIKAILRHLNLWVTQKRPPPRIILLKPIFKKLMKVEREWRAHKQPFRLR